MTTKTSPQFFHCDECGTLVGWTSTRDGQRYLANWSHQYENGARYRRGAHYKTCADSKEAREEREARAAKAQATALEVARSLDILRRWTFVYGEEFRDWGAKDPEAARAHLDAIWKRLGV